MPLIIFWRYESLNCIHVLQKPCKYYKNQGHKNKLEKINKIRIIKTFHSYARPKIYDTRYLVKFRSKTT